QPSNPFVLFIAPWSLFVVGVSEEEHGESWESGLEWREMVENVLAGKEVTGATVVASLNVGR
nr:hypothetical protein [Tanacetum cinerariifolium]